MIVRAPAENEGLASPEFTDFGVVSAWQIHRFPDVLASQIPKCVTDPQLAVGAGKVIAALLLVCPPVPLDAVVLPADCVPAHCVSPAVTATRA